MSIWNPWHGCHKLSPGCWNCYVYRRDESVGRQADLVARTGDFSLPLRKDRSGDYKLAPGSTVFTCMTSDFFLEEADPWRADCWSMMRERSDLSFSIITKRVSRFMECVPPDWGSGYPNVTVYCTVEDQKRAEERLPLFLRLPIAHKRVCMEPLLEEVDLTPYLAEGGLEYVFCGGESGLDARPCRYEWVLSVREQCLRFGVGFHFKQTGAVFVKDGKVFHVERKLQLSQAAKAGIDVLPASAGSDTVPDPFFSPPTLNREDWLKRDLFERIAESSFRSRFYLRPEDRQYVREKGMSLIRSHAEDFVADRLAPAAIPNDGKQTPMRGHPVFPAQHACACCCRGCLEKWHGIPAGVPLTAEQQKYVVDTLMEWIRRQMAEGK